MPFFVYIIECANRAFYTGITTDLKRRFEQHRTGRGARYTSYNPAVKIRYYKRYATRSAAAKREHEIKSWPRRKKLALIERSKRARLPGGA
ncbi:MAG: GIY-YIG nuclease family protein [Candidatus Margulisiibacteriota bacterium]